MNKTTYVCFNIKWDTDGYSDAEFDGPPSQMIISVPIDIANNPTALEEYLSDKLSDESGWCHFGFDFQPI
jgi:hypothetical protein